MELAFLAADFIDGVVDEADDVVLVEGEGGVRKMVADAFDESFRHIDADLGNGLGISLMGLEVLGEGGDGGGIFAGSDEQDFSLVQIDEEGNVILAAAGGGLIDADLSDGRMVGFATRRIHVMIDDAPHAGVVFTDQSRDSQDGHGLGELDNEGFKQQGEAAFGPGPRDGDAVDAAEGTFDAGRAGMEIRLVLEEVQVAPGERFGVVGLAVGGGADRARKGGASREVEEDVEAAGLDGESATVDEPGRQQTQSGLQELVFGHGVFGQNSGFRPEGESCGVRRRAVATGRARAVEMTELWTEWKTKSRFPTLSTAPWESRKGEIPTFPQLRRFRASV